MSSMTGYDIRSAAPDDPAHERLGSYAFADTPRKPDDEEERQLRNRIRKDDRIFFSYVDGDAVAKSHTLPMTMNVRGVVLPMGGVSGVACMPVARRGGHIRALLNHSLNVMREDAQPISALYPFRESFYQQFGFAGWPAARWVSFDPTDLLPVLKMPKRGRLRQRSMADGFADWQAFLKTRQAEVHGFSLKGTARSEWWIGDNRYWVTTVHEDDEVTGAMIYRITDEVSTMLVMSALWSTVDAHYQLLDFIARHADQVERARICFAPGTSPELWLTDLKAKVRTDDPEAWLPPMARIVSIEGLQGIGAGNGEMVVQVTDPQCPWNEGAWTLRGASGELEVTQGGTPTASLTVQGLSALVFSGIDPALLRFRGWGDPDEASIAALRMIFPPVEPFISEMF